MKPMTTNTKKTTYTIPFHKASIGEEEIQAVTDTLQSGWLTMGPKTVEFEEKFKSFIGCDHAVSMNSATACLHLALKAIDIKKNNEIIIPTMTFISTAEVITYFNAIPVLCDIEPNTHNIDPTKVEALITPQTKAIIPVHFAGNPCDMDPIIAIAKKHNLYVIEDAAHALPTTYKDKKIGTLGDITCFSFYATKTLCTGEGGMATTNNPKFAESMTINRLHGINNHAWNRYSDKGSWYYEVVDNGYKYNMTDINAALGLVQLKKQNLFQKKRQKIAHTYTQEFTNTPQIIPITTTENSDSAWHLYVIKVTQNRSQLIDELKTHGISCSVHFIPVHKHPYYKKTYGYHDQDYPIANQIFESCLSLPIYPDLSPDEHAYIINTLSSLTPS
jgi:dTDP-4-amino-4,6-dideoxygalactose transaminase